MQLKQFYNIITKVCSRKKCYYFWWPTWLITWRSIPPSAMIKNALYATINFNTFLYLMPCKYYVIAAKHIVTVTISISIHNSLQHNSSHHHHHRVSYPTQDLVILKWILMLPGETHDSGYCLNGLPSTQPPLFLLNWFDLIIFSNHLLLHITWLRIFLSLCLCLMSSYTISNV